MIYVKVWGLRRSGTNWLTWLLEQNFECRVLQNVLGWKHLPTPCITFDGSNWQAPDGLSSGPFPGDVEDLEDIHKAHALGELRQVCIVKDPYAWVVSVYRRYGRRAGSLADLCERWNEAGRNYFERDASPLWLMVRYEALLEAPVAVLIDLKFDGELPSKGKPYTVTDRRMRPASDADHGDAMLSGQTFDPTYYTERKFMRFFDDEALDVVRGHIDRGLMERLGHQTQ